MEASPRRSPARLVTCLPLLALGLVACGSSSTSLENLPPPCIKGYSACASTGLCVRKKDDAEEEFKREQACRYRTVRQGGSLVIEVPGATADRLPLVTSASPELIAERRVVGRSVVVDLRAHHGARLGEVPEHKVTIASQIGGRPYERELQVLVQAIAASPDGNDEAEGSESQPFRTFRKAASVAGDEDTILLRNDNGYPSEPDERDLIVVPAGVTVRGQVPRKEQKRDGGTAEGGSGDDAGGLLPVPTGGTGAILGMPIALAGGATLDNLVLTRHLVISAPDEKVTLNDVEAWDGLSLAPSATKAELVISGASKVKTDKRYAPRSNPILVEADDTALSIGGSTEVDHDTGLAMAPAIKVSGRRHSLKVDGDALIQGITHPVAIQLDDAKAVKIDGRAPDALTIRGRVEIAGTNATVDVNNAYFPRGNNGGSGIKLTGTGETSRMQIAHSSFQGEALILAGVKSRTIIRNSTFADITGWAIRLESGALDLGTPTEPGKNRFWTKDEWDPAVTPVALRVDAKVGEGSVTSSASSYDGWSPGELEVPGPRKDAEVQRGFVRIEDDITIFFFP